MTNLEKWNFWLDTVESPQIFLDFTWYATISSILQRRVCIFGGQPIDKPTGQTYPNIFVVFMAKPGVGKSVPGHYAKDLMQNLTVKRGAEAKEPEYLIKTGPSSTTYQALLKYLANNYTTTNLGDITGNEPEKGKLYLHASLALLSTGELSCLLDADSEGLVAFLTDAWDGNDFIRDTKTQGTDIIKRPCLTLLGSGTPDWLRQVTASQLLKKGFAARSLILYAERPRKRCYVQSFNVEQLKARQELIDYIKKLSTIYGRVRLTPEAEEFIKIWYDAGGSDLIPGVKNLDDYFGRKRQHLYKMILLVHFSDNLDMLVTLETVKKALAILTAIEPNMEMALSFSGENPIYICAQEIIKLIRNSPEGYQSKASLIANLFDRWNLDLIDHALRFLTDTQQISNDKLGPRGLLFGLKDTPQNTIAI